MVAVPTAWPEYVTGDALDTSHLNGYVRDPIAFLMCPPRFQARRVAAQSIANGGSGTALSWDTVELDIDVDGVGGHSLVSTPSRYIARYDGWYWVGGGIGYATNATNRRGCRWAVNGTQVDGSEIYMNASAANQTVLPARAMLLRLTVGDYLEMVGYQDSGGALNTSTASAGHYPSISVMWAGIL